MAADGAGTGSGAERSPPGAVEAREPSSDSREEARLLREEVLIQREEAHARDLREEKSDRLKNRVSVAAVILTTALSFIGNVKSERSDAASGAGKASEAARQQAAELWSYYQTKIAERASVEIARDRIRLDLSRRGLQRDDPEAKLDAFKLTSYEERLRDFDLETEKVFFRVQELERDQDVRARQAIEPARAAFRYELGSKIITLALILLSVAILSNSEWLLGCGIGLGAAGLLVALNGWFLFF